MIFSIRNIVRNKFLNMGVHIHGFPTPGQFYDLLKNKPDQIRIHELKKLVESIHETGNHTYYEKLLDQFIPERDIDKNKSEFIGEGSGKGSLNSYRKLTVNDQELFEKVYLNSHPSLQNVLYFQDHVYEWIKDKIKIPAIKKVYTGDLITAVYFEFLELVPLDNQDIEARLVEFSKDLMTISFAQEFEIKKLDLVRRVLIFKQRLQYKKRTETANYFLTKSGLQFDSLEDAAEKSKLVLTHADIHKTNAFQNNVLIDWDFFGMYPLGYDPAFLYFTLKKKEPVSREWLRRYYSEIISKELWPNFERNFTFFLFVFSGNRFLRGEYQIVKEELIKNLKKSVEVEIF